VDHVDIGTASCHTSNIEEEDVVLSEGHYGFIAARIWRLFDVHPLDCRATSGFHETHVEVVQFSMG
jgi:hypothetical protein